MMFPVVLLSCLGLGAAQPALEWLGADPANLAVCQGDCDNDGDCPGASECIQRTNGSPAAVAGCTTGDSGTSGRADTDYCNSPVVAPTPAPVPTILGGMVQGAKFEHCIAIADWEGKTLADEIPLQHRDANGCCPVGTVPGVKHVTSYVSGQVVCGFKADGTVAMSGSTTNGVKSCTYNQCYVWKSNLNCAAGVQRLNGCCAAKVDCSSSGCGFKEGCKHYSKTNPQNSDAGYCTTYDKDYKMEYTSAKNDDQANDKLQIDKVYIYTPCSGGVVGGDTGDASGARWMPLGVTGMLLAFLAAISNA